MTNRIALTTIAFLAATGAHAAPVDVFAFEQCTVTGDPRVDKCTANALYATNSECDSAANKNNRSIGRGIIKYQCSPVTIDCAYPMDYGNVAAYASRVCWQIAAKSHEYIPPSSVQPQQDNQEFAEGETPKENDGMQQGEHMVLGIGNLQCSEVSRDFTITTPGRLTLQAYISGYVTALNQVSEDNGDLTPGTDPEHLVKIVAKLCLSHKNWGLEQAIVETILSFDKSKQGERM